MIGASTMPAILSRSEAAASAAADVLLARAATVACVTDAAASSSEVVSTQDDCILLGTTATSFQATHRARASLAQALALSQAVPSEAEGDLLMKDTRTMSVHSDSADSQGNPAKVAQRPRTGASPFDEVAPSLDSSSLAVVAPSLASSSFALQPFPSSLALPGVGVAPSPPPTPTGVGVAPSTPLSPTPPARQDDLRSEFDFDPSNLKEIKKFAADMVIEGLQKARQENDTNRQIEEKNLIERMSDTNRRESEAAINHCVSGLVERISGVETIATETQTEVKALHLKFDAMTIQNNQLNAQVAKLAQKLGTSASAPNLAAAGSAPVAGSLHNHIHIPVVASPFAHSNFNRTPDPSKIFVNIHGKINVPIDAFVIAFAALATEVNISPDQYKIIGDALDSRFEINFTSDSASAARNCASFLASLSVGRGQFKPQFVEIDAGTKHQFYCNPDKNMAQVRREILCRNLKELIEPFVTAMGKTAAMRKTTGSVMVDRKVVGTVFLVNEQAARIHWYTPLVLSLGLDIVAIDAAFCAVAGGASSP